MLGHTISYRGDNTQRRAIIDLIRWFGLNKSTLILRAMRQCKTFADIDRVDISISMAGVTGEPVRRLIAYVHGEPALIRWSAAKRGDTTLVNGEV